MREGLGFEGLPIVSTCCVKSLGLRASAHGHADNPEFRV